MLTNLHVVAGTRGAPLVTGADGVRREARVVATSRPLDLALLALSEDGLPPAPIGDSARLRVGELVFAVGHPWGQPWAVSAGIVSGLGPRDYLRSDVRLAPGSSGGPLVDARGDVVGRQHARARGRPRGRRCRATPPGAGSRASRDAGLRRRAHRRRPARPRRPPGGPGPGGGRDGDGAGRRAGGRGRPGPGRRGVAGRRADGAGRRRPRRRRRAAAAGAPAPGRRRLGRGPAGRRGGRAASRRHGGGPRPRRVSRRADALGGPATPSR